MAFDLEEIRQSTDPSVLEGVQGAQEPQPAQEQAEPAVAPQGGTIDIPKEGIGPAVILEDESGRATLAPASGADGHMLSAKEARVRHEQSGLDYGSFLNAEQARRWQAENTSPEGRQGIRATLLTAKGIKPEQIARDKELAMRLGISPEQVHYAVETAEDEDFARQLEQFDRLTEFASRSPYHAAYAKGFFDDLTKIEMEEAERHIAEREAKASQWAGPVASAAVKSMRMTFPNESSAKTISGAIDRSKAQAVMSETVDQLIQAHGEGRTEDAERMRETLKMQQAALAQIGPEDEFDASIASKVGLGYAFEQSHTSLPIMFKSLGIGALGFAGTEALAALGGAVAGGVGAGAAARAALPRALKVGEGATIAAASYYTFFLERNLALPEILAMKDEAGHTMPLDIAIEAATAYGAVAAGLETIAEKAALNVFKPVTKLGRGPAARYIAKAIMANPSLRQGAQALGRALGPTARITLGKLWQLFVAGSAEAFTEATQATSEVTARSYAAKTANWRIGGERASDPSAPAGSFDERIFTPENIKQIKDEAKAGFAGGFWFGVLPAAASGVYHSVRVQSARAFADREIQRHAAVEQSQLTQLDPSAMSEYLQTVAPELEQEVMIPMDRAVTLHQQGIDIISPFGVSIEEAQRAAASGQALNVPLSELHSRLDAAQFKAAADIMQRRQVDAMAEEAQTSDEDLLRRLAQPLDNAERIEAARNAESWMTPEQRAAYGQEIERLRKEMRIAIQGVPNVLAQAEAQGGLEAYLEGVIVPLRRTASMLARRTGQNPADVARKIIIDSARRAQQAQANATAEERAAADIEAEFSEPVQEEPVHAAQEAAPAQEQEAEAEPVQTAQEAAPEQEPVLNEGPDELPPVPPEVQARWDAAEQASQAQESPVQEQAQEAQPEAQAGQEVQAEELQAQAQEQEAPAEPVQANPRRAVGNSVPMYVPSGEDEQITYQVWELEDVIPSHDPTNNFARNPEYPETAQERPYHSDKGEREKVLRQYAELKPGYLVTDNPDATTGPSVITPAGIVLGGNSRIMTIQLVYANGGEKAAAYRKAVEDRAQHFGIDPAAVSAMNQPVLVRVLDKAMTPLEMAQASRRLNVSTTQALQSEAEGVSKSRLVSEGTLASFTAGVQEFDTVRDFLSSAKSRDFVQGLMDDGVIEATQASRLTDAKTGLLNSEGKDLVVNTLRGLVIQDYDIIRKASELAPSVLDKIDRAVPDLVALRNMGGQWVKVVESLQEAVNQINKWLASGSDTFPHTLGNLHLHFDQAGLLADPAKAKKAVNALAVTLATATSKEFQARVATMEAEARNASEKGAMASMLGEADKPVSPAGAFVRAFLKPVAVINGKAVRGFNPETNPLHEAMQWASENSGTAHTFEAAQSRLAAILSDKKASKEAKAEAKERLQKLSGREGKIYVYGRPMLGAFQYRKSLGDVLWQRMEEEAIEAVRRQYQGTEQWMRAPNGNATHLTERQWLQVRTPAFKAWFGDWEANPANASKVVDENGEPMVMYHQSPYQFEVFRRGTRGGKSGNGIYFSYRPLEQFGGERYAVFLNLRNPLTKENAPEGVLKKMGRMVMGVDAEAFDQHPEFDGAMAVNTEVTVREPNQIKSATDNVGTFGPNNPNILYQSRADAQMDADYFAAIGRGDMDAVQSMVDARAEAMGFGDAIPEQTEAYRVRTKPAPKKTIFAYKTVTIADDGSPSALFVGGTAKLPVGVWLDAVTPWHIINAKNGKAYVPSTQNPWTEGGKTGDTVVIREEDRAELLRRGFIKKPTAKTVTGLSFRPGLHFGSMPAFPQGGKTAIGANYQIKGKEPLGMVHRRNQVVYLCEIDADHDYTAEARAQPKAQTKKGTVNAQAADLQYMPEGGFYEYTTNPQNMGHPERGVWYISGSMKLVRPLTQEECDRILQENGLPPQEWEGGEDGKSGKLDLSALNVNPEQNDAARKTLAPITYDENGQIIPLSKRFDRSNPSVFYQSMPVPENPLVALHNIDADNLVASARLGGLPVPSIGVTKAETPYSDFGGISLIGTRDLVDPAETPVFTRDAYTARFPHTSWKAPKQSDVSRVLKSALPYLQKYEDVQAYNFEYHLKYVPDRDAAIDLFLASSGGRAMYLESKGETVAPVMTETPETAYCSRDPLVRSVAKHLIFKNNGKIPDEFTDGELRSLARAYREAVEKRNLDKDTERLMLDIVDDNGLMSKADAFDLVSAVKRDLNAPEGVVDKTATRRMLKEKVPLDDAGFKEFAENLIGGIFKGQTISIGKREVPLTLDNVVRAMSSKQVRNQEHAGSQSFGPGELRAAAADRLSSVDEYNEYRDMLVDQEAGNSAGGHFRNLLSDFDTNVRIYYKNDNAGGWYSDELRRALATFTGYKKGSLKSNLAKALKKHGFEKIDKDSDDSIVFELGEEMYWELKAGTATYMEAKPQRAVMLDEFLGAVIPSDTSAEARKVLADNGITVMEYKPGDLKDKQAKVSQLSSRLAQTQEAIILFQRAWHGSPFNFDRFTLSHIGDGEGAQVHGWGLYFAQSREISDKRYRERLTKRLPAKHKAFVGESENETLSEIADNVYIYQLPGWYQEKNISKEELDAHLENVIQMHQHRYDRTNDIKDIDIILDAMENGASPDEAIDELTFQDKYLDIYEKIESKYYEDEEDEVADFKNTLLSMREEYVKENEKTEKEIETIKSTDWSKVRIEETPQTGQLFEVEIPENDVLLDEQKSIAEQPAVVKKALANLGIGFVDETALNQKKEELERLEKQINDISAQSDEASERLAKKYGPAFGGEVYNLSKKGELSNEDALDYAIVQKTSEAMWPIYDKIAKIRSEIEHLEDVEMPANGREAYEILERRNGGSAKAASLALKEQGVLGITYEGGTDGRCFVIWDEEAIQIYNTLYQTMQQAHDQQLDQAPDAFARGSVTDTGDQYFIELFKGADLSTLFHELSHTYWLSMEKYVRDGLADAEMVSDWEKLCKWLGATPGQALTVDQHEMLARGWEGYFMEGKAPSVELEGVFQRIKRWFLRIYRDIKALNVELTDEVRGVFDRMLATQEEIEDAAAQAELVDLTTGELQAMGVSPVQMAYTRRVLDEAKAKAAERLQQKRDQERKARLADYRRQAHEELSQLQHNVARSDMRKTPIDLDAVRALMGDDFANALMKKQPGAFKKGGMDPGQFAMQHGYQTAQEMLADLASAKTLGEEVEDQVRRMDAEFDAQFDATDELLDTEEVAEHASLVARHLANIAGRPYIQQQAVNKVALQEMQAMSMTRAMRVGDFRANMRRALRDERRAIANGKYAEALEANTKARLNLEMARIAQELREDVDRTARQCKRFAGSKSIAEVPKAFLARLVQRHSFLGPDWLQALVEKYSDQDILAWQKAVEADGYTMQIDDEVYLTQTPWRDMTMEQWESFSDALRQVITIERNQRKILTAKGKQDLEDIAQEIEDSLAAHNKAKVNGRAVPDAVRALRKYHAIHMKVEQMCLLLDGGKPGPMWNYIYKPISDAAEDQAMRLRDARDYLRDKLFGMFSKQEFKQLGKKEWVQSVGRSMTKEERLCVALNLGNSVNMERIRSGFGWTDAQISDVVSTLTERDWRFVQAVWDYINTFREPSFRVHQEVTGSRPVAVEGEPITVRTADGKTLQLKGGYYPIKYDPVESSIEYARTQEQLDQQLMGGRNHGAAQTRHGHLRERTEGGLGSPLLLTFDVLTGHVFNTIHDFTHRKAVLDVAKIIRNRKVMAAIEAYGGSETYRELMPWLQDVANETQTPQSSVQRMASWARSSATIMQMGYKLTTIVMVPAGITQSVTEIGWGWTACGYGHVLKALAGGWQGIQAMWQEVTARSAFMAGRIESFDRDVRDFSKRINAGPVAGWIDRIRNTAFLPMGYYQLATVDLPTWWGAFEKGLRENQGDEAKAAAYADSVVRLTQASGATKDLARVQRGSDIHRMLTMFYSYFNTLYNLGAKHIKALREDHTPAGIWRAANAALLLWFLPSVASELMAGRGPDDGDDEDLEGWLKWAARIWIQVPFQACVGVRDVASAVFSEFDYQLSPAQSAPASVVKFFKSIGKAIEEEDPSLMVKPTAEAVGYALKLPGKQPIITAQNMWEYCTDPNSEFYLRDLFFVKPKSRQPR